MGERSYPFDDSDSYEADWLRMARLWAPSHIVGDSTANPYGCTLSGLTATISCRPGQVTAEAWVDGSMHELAYDATTQGQVVITVPTNATANPRVDRIVLRRDPEANKVRITRLEGTPAASPVAPTLTQVPGGVYDLPLWRFTVPANNGAPLTGLVDDRFFANPDTGWQGASAVGGDVTASWIARTPASAVNLTAAAWAPQLRLLVGVGSAALMTSPDGITWTARTAPGLAWSSVCWSPERSLFVAVATFGGPNNIATSPDGITWTQRSQPNAYALNDVVWAGDLGLFVAVANNASTSTAAGRVITSPDGITWTARSLGGTGAGTPTNVYAVAYSPQLKRLAAAFGDNTSTQQILYSTDGVNWTAGAGLSAARTWRDIVWSPERSLFVAVNDSNGSVATSPDGIIWTLRDSVAGSASAMQFTGVEWAAGIGMFLATASTSAAGYPRLWVSPNGITWSARPDPVPNSVWRGAVWSRELARFVIVGDSGALATSFC